MRRLNPSHGFALVTRHQVLHRERAHARATVFCNVRLVSRETIIRIREECKCIGLSITTLKCVAERGNDERSWGEYIAARIDSALANY